MKNNILPPLMRLIAILRTHGSEQIHSFTEINNLFVSQKISNIHKRYERINIRKWGALCFLALGLLMSPFLAYGQVAVTVTNPTNTTPNLAASYTSLANAITALNSITAISGGTVTLTCATGTETAPVGGYAINFIATTTAVNNIVITGTATTTLTAFTPQASGTLNDAIFKIIGSDFVTIQSFTMRENPANLTTAAGTNNMTEFGVALFYATTTNGAQNNTIQNNTISLNRTYQNTFGIYSNSTHSATNMTTSATATTTAGGNSGLKVYNNAMSNINNGIVVLGPTAAANFNTSIEIGGATLGNTITNFGTTGTFSAYANLSGSVYGVLIRNIIGYIVSNNTITSSAGGVTSGTLRGIYNVNASNAPTGTFTNNINNNTISLTYGVATGTLEGITVEATTGTATSTQNINSNNFTALTSSIATSATVTAISNAMANLNTSISSNTFTNITTNTTGSFTFIANAISVPTSGGTQTISSNSIVTAFNKTGAGGTVTVFSSNASSATGSVINMTNNNFSNITVTGATAFVGINNTDGGSPTKTITGNTFNNISGGTGSINPMTVNFLGGTSSVSSNTITNITWGSAITALTIGNTSSATTLNVNLNIINNITTTTGNVVGITNSSPSTTTNISSNIINTLSSTGAASTITGIIISGATTTNVFKNKIYDLSGSNASATVNGISITSGTTINTYNNLIGDLRTPAANAANPLIGINITGGTTSNVYYNTVFLNATSSGALFGSSAISVSTTPTVTLRNNIFVNNSTTTGAGLAVAYRRSSTTLTSYGATSNNNLFFTNSSYYTDGTNTDATFAAYKTRVSTRDAVSVSENPTWQSTAGSSANFLKYDINVASLADNAGAIISGDDFGGITRDAATPDMGAWELTITPLLTIANNGTQPAAGNVNQGSTNNILQTFTITEGNRANATLNTVTIPTGANYTAADIQALGLKLWSTTVATFTSPTLVSSFTSISGGSGELLSFGSLTQTIAKNTTVYFWVTADISATATAGNTINANALAPANVVFALGTPTGTVSVGGLQTIVAVTPTIALANGGAPVLNPLQNTTNVVLYRVDVTVAVTGAVLTSAQFTTAGTYAASDVNNFKIWYHNNTDFTVGTPVQIGMAKTTGLGAGLQSFTGLTRVYGVGTNYLFFTTDLLCTSTVSNTISVDAINNTDFTFATGTPTGAGYTSGGVATINAVIPNNATLPVATAGSTQVSLAWVAPTGCYDEIMIVVAPATNLGTPTGNGSAYTASLTYGGGTALSNGFVAYKGTTSPQVITGLTNFTTYFFKIFTRNGSTWSSGVEVSAMPQPVYCGAPLTTTVNIGDRINQIVLTNSIPASYTNTTTSNGTTNYDIYNNTPLNLEIGTNNSIAITFGTDGTQHSAVWIDYNQNGIYEASENIALSSVSAGGSTTVTYNFTVPIGANVGNTRMRVRGGSDAAHTAGGACTQLLYGETEDYLVNITPASPQTLGTIASAQATPATVNKNTTNNPILRIDLPTTGALGTLTLTNLVVTSANVSDADVAINGVKLYYTTTTTFSTANPVGTGQSFASGTATFSSLTRLLANGNNYLWVTYDVATTATAGNTLDAQIAIGNMTITEAGGATATGSIPASALNPVGSILIILRNPLTLNATAFSTSQINLSNTANADGDNIMVAWNSTNTFGTPTGTYIAGNSIGGVGTVLYVGTVAGLVNHTGLTANTQYFYSVWTNSGSIYSTTTQIANATTLPNPLNYVFSQSNGTYGEITPTTVLFTNVNDAVSVSQTIPSFTYNGAAYTNMFVSSNGFLKLGAATGPGSGVYTPLSTASTALQNTISAFSVDLGGIDATSVIGWSTIGNEIIVQWKNVRRLSVAGESVNFQIRMNTVTSEINIVYGAFASGTSANTMQVGLRGFDQTWRTQISNRQGNLEWDKTTMGTNNISALPMTTTNLPASGLTFTYTPNTCTPFPIIGAVMQLGTDVTVNWTTQAEAADGYDVRYRLQSAGIGTYITVNVPLQASNNTIISGLGAGVYIFEVRTRCSGVTFSDYSNAVVFIVIGNYYLKALGVITNVADWGTNTDGTGANPSALTEPNAGWNIRNNTTVTNPSAWTLGLGSKIIVGDGTTPTNFILPAGQNVTGTIDVNNVGTLTLQNTINPTLGVLAVGSTVDYNGGTVAQTIAVANYSNLTISGARSGSPTLTLASGTINISGAFVVTTTGVGTYINTGNTVNFSSASMQAIPAFRYRNITNTGNGNRTLAPSGEVNIAGTFATGTGTYTTTGSTVNYSATAGGGFILASFNYNNLIFSGTQTFSIGIGNTINVSNDFTLSGAGTFNVNNTTGVTTFSVGNDINVSNGFFNVINSTTASSTNVNITRDLNLSGTGVFILENTASTLGIAIINVGRNFTATSTVFAMVDFGDDVNTNNTIRIAGNFTKSGAGRFETAGSGASLGFVFNGTGTQTFSYSGANSPWTQYVVASGATVQMNTGLTLPNNASLPIATFTVNSGGTLDMNTQVITAGNTTDPVFTLASGGTVKTSQPSGLTSNFTGFGASRLVLSSLANYEFNASVAQVTSAFVTTPTANTVNNLIINNNTATSTTGVTLTNSLIVGGVLNLTQGKVTTGANTLFLQPGAGAVIPSLGKATSYVVGNVNIIATADLQTLLFPTGNGTWWAPAMLVTNGGAGNTTFNVRYNNTSHPFNAQPLPTTPEIISTVLQAYWDIDRTVNTRNADVQLYWNDNLGAITDPTALRILHGGATAWENYGVDNTNGNASDGTAGTNTQGSIIKNGVSTFSPFSIGSTTGVNPLPLTLISFAAKRQNNERVNLTWQTANEIDLRYFAIEKSNNGTDFREVGRVEAQNATAQTKNYAFADTEKASAYYRLRFIHYKNTDEFSVIRFVRGTEDDFISVYPNPLQGKISFEVSENLKLNQFITLQVTDMSGKNIATFTGDWKKISEEISQSYPNWASGLYFWNIAPQGEKITIIKVIKQ